MTANSKMKTIILSQIVIYIVFKPELIAQIVIIQFHELIDNL